MKAVIQRVLNANVTVDGQIVASIGNGLCVLLGIHRDDTEKDLEYIVRKILNFRVFENDEGRNWAASVTEKDFEILCISQFTLIYCMKGNKPDFHRAMPAATSEPLYEKALQALRSQYKEDKIKAGKFGARMQIQLVNDGPVTLQFESSPSKE